MSVDPHWHHISNIDLKDRVVLAAVGSIVKEDSRYLCLVSGWNRDSGEVDGRRYIVKSCIIKKKRLNL
jgi:hypothetical protein